MKKLVLSLSIMGLIYGCKKDQITPNSFASNSITSNNSSEVSEIERKILSFGDLMENEQLMSDKNGCSSMNVVDAEWNLEAMANYNYRESQEFDVIEVDSNIIVIVKEQNGEINIPNIRKANVEIKKALLNLTKHGKFLVVLDVNIENETANEVTFNVISNIGRSDIGNKIFYTQFDLSWNWGFGAGECGYTGPWLGIDAADIIPSRIPLEISDNQIVTNVVSTGFLSNMEAQPLANPFGYDNGPLFGAHGTGTSVVPTICFTPTMLVFYENSLINFAEDLRPVGKTTILHDLESTNSLATSQWDALHLANFTYATLTSRRTLN